MSAYWWYVVTFEMDEFPVEVLVTVAAMSESDAATYASNILYDMGYRGGSRRYLIDRQDRVEAEV